MAVVIRLSRQGTRGKPFYRLVAVDSRSPRGGSSLENVGTYDPRKGVEAVTLKEERIKHWLKEGAKPSRTVDEILRRAKIL